MVGEFKMNPVRLAIAVIAIALFVWALPTNTKATKVEVQAVPVQKAFVEERYIAKLAPDYKEAKELGQHLHFVSESLGVDSKLLVAIAFQESAFQTDAVNNNDLGLFQLNYIHQITRKGRPYSIQEVKEDWRLNSILAAQYLRECMAVKPQNKLEPFTCYHSFTYEKALIYQQAVKKHLNKLAEVK